jgi:hypothetical protein
VHRQWVEIQGTNAVLMVASDGPGPVEAKLAEWRGRLSEQFAGDDQGRQEAEGLLSSADALLGQADTEADALVSAFARANALRDEEAPEIPSDDTLENRQRALAPILGRLFELFGEDPGAVLESARSALTERLAGMLPLDEVRRRVSSTLNEFRPLGLKSLDLGPEDIHGEYEIFAEASPRRPLLSLIPESRGKSMKSIVSIWLKEAEEGPLALERRTLQSGREVQVPVGTQAGIGAVERRGRRGQSLQYWLLEPVGGGTIGESLLAGGALLAPEPAAREVKLVTWNTGDITRDATNNITHAERQFYGWFIRQPPEWLARVTRIEIENLPYSPCTACADNLISLLSSVNPRNIEEARLVWRKPYTVGPLATRPDTLSSMRGWKIEPSSVPPLEERYQIE